MKRLQIGLIALVLLIGAIARFVMIGSVSDLLLGALLRIGLIMAALWLALPTLSAIFNKTPKWMLVALVASAVVFALRPSLLWWIPVAMLAIWFVWSRFGFGPGAGSSGQKVIPRRPKRKA